MELAAGDRSVTDHRGKHASCIKSAVPLDIASPSAFLAQLGRIDARQPDGILPDEHGVAVTNNGTAFDLRHFGTRIRAQQGDRELCENDECGAWRSHVNVSWRIRRHGRPLWPAPKWPPNLSN